MRPSIIIHYDYKLLLLMLLGMGSTWGLGGTCTNVGCIPKKLMHEAALSGETVSNASCYGWDLPSQVPSLNWNDLVANIQGHIKSINWGFKVALATDSVTYFHDLAAFEDSHTLRLTSENGQEKSHTANIILIATGCRPRYLDIPGGRKHEFTVTSDDLFSLKYHPGKVLCVGAGYIALECASFLSGFGCEVTVMARSILLRGFDRDLVNILQSNLEQRGVRFQLNCSPVEIKKLEDGTPPTLQVTSKAGSKTRTETYNTVLVAIGRHAQTSTLNLQAAGVQVHAESGKIVTDKCDRTNVKHIYALGDVAHERPELTPPAIKAGQLLANRLFGGSKMLMDYSRIPTTIFTHTEYSKVGMTEEEAIEKHGEKNIEVYHTSFGPLEFQLTQNDQQCFCKIICLKASKERVLGFHFLGPHAGEVCQGFAVALRMGMKKADLDTTIGIHPTNAEIATMLHITKSSGAQAVHTQC